MKKLLAIIFIATASQANAEYIETPAYPKGQAQVNETLNFTHGKTDGVDSSLELSYGISDRLAAIIAFNGSGGQDLKYDYYNGADITAQIDLVKETDNLPGTALRLTYSPASADTPDNVSSMLVLEKKSGNINSFINLAIGKTVGNNSVGGPELGAAAQVMYGLNDYTENDEWAVGAEYFGDFGKTGLIQGFPQKGQQIGPIIGFQPYKNLETSLNYMVGLTHDQPRSTISFEINLTF